MTSKVCQKRVNFDLNWSRITRSRETASLPLSVYPETDECRVFLAPWKVVRGFGNDALT